MKRIKCDIWDFHEAFIVIPINLEGVCGRGLAKQMSDRFPEVAATLRRDGKTGRLADRWASAELLEFFTPELTGGEPGYPFYRIVPFPVKRLWRDQADINMIERSTYMLVSLLKFVQNPFYCVMPQVGCGFGEMTIDDVLPTLERVTSSVFERVLLADPDPAVFSKYTTSFKPGWRADKTAVEANLPAESGGFGNFGGFPDLKVSLPAPDPVHQGAQDQKWYFWDKSWNSRIGPYDTELESRLKLQEYRDSIVHNTPFEK